jgi:hypothetical protein
LFSRHWFSTQLAKWLEPRAVKHASLITGVAEGYYEGVQQRNPHLLQKCVFGAMPYGGEKSDHDALKQLSLKPYLFQKSRKLQIVYAGAMLPKAYAPLECIFKAINQDIDTFENITFQFIGTGKIANDPESFNIKPLAEKYGLWQTIVFEYPQRIPYLDVLIHLEAADGVFILGSTEPHYTPSKAYQGVLSKKSIFAVLHQNSTAVNVISDSNAGKVLAFDGESGLDQISRNFTSAFSAWASNLADFDPLDVNHKTFEKYSAGMVTATLVSLLDKALEK